jgi:hypothetical protein
MLGAGKAQKRKKLRLITENKRRFEYEVGAIG